VEGDELFDANEGAGAVVDEDFADVGREGGEGGGDGVLALFAAGDEDGGGGGVGGKLEHLLLVAVNDDVEIGDAAFGEGEGGVEEEGVSAERGEDLVLDGTVHALAASGGEEDGGGARHVF